MHFIHNDAAGYVADEECDVAACIDVNWIARGVAGMIDLLSESPKPSGVIFIGEPYRSQVPATEEIAQVCGVPSLSDLVASFDEGG